MVYHIVHIATGLFLTIVAPDTARLWTPGNAEANQEWTLQPENDLNYICNPLYLTCLGVLGEPDIPRQVIAFNKNYKNAYLLWGVNSTTNVIGLQGKDWYALHLPGNCTDDNQALEILPYSNSTGFGFELREFP